MLFINIRVFELSGINKAEKLKTTVNGPNIYF